MEVVSGLLFGGATHLVQRVEVDVRVSVEMVVVTFSTSEVPEVTVFVIGHVVKVVYTLFNPCQLMSNRRFEQGILTHRSRRSLECSLVQKSGSSRRG